MSRTKRSIAPRGSIENLNLLKRLVDELKAGRAGGQPMIHEEEFPSTGLLRVVVIWDDWDGIPDEERTRTIFEAYRQAEGPEHADRITLVGGLTVSEGYNAGLLPYQVVPLLRRGAPVTLEQCGEAMLAEGASTLSDRDRPPLRFFTEEEAAASIKRLVKRLPASEPVWSIVENVLAVHQVQ